MSDENENTNLGGSEVPMEHAKELGEALAHIDVLRAGHEGLALGVSSANEGINAVGQRVDALAGTVEKMAEDIAALKPAAAAGEGAEEGGDLAAGGGTEAPAGVAQTAEKEHKGPLAGFHGIFG